MLLMISTRTMCKTVFFSLLYLCFWVLPSLALDFTRGPFVQNASTNRIQIIWQTSEPATSFVEYGRTTALSMAVVSEQVDTNHVLTLDHLGSATQYFYRVTSRNDHGALISSLATFSTLKTGGSISFAVISDTARNSVFLPQPLLANVMTRLGPELVMHLGDIVATDFNRPNVQNQFFDIFQPVIRNTPFYLMIGNHDLFPAPGEIVDLNATGFQNAFHLPTNSMDGTSRYYSFDHGDVHFVCLFNPWFYVYDFNPQTDQYRWLTNDLASSAKPWKLLFFHAPIATSSLHAADDYNWNGIPDQTEMMDLMAPLARRYGVQMVFNGHDHSLHRYPPQQGLHFCVTAGGGQALYPFTTPYAGLAKYWERHHCLKVGITNDTMTLEAYDTSGVRFDAWTLQKALPPRRLYQSAWHTPAIAATAANDGDGNVGGQSFDFAGTPIYPRAGQFSNLGRVYVNNDETNLYVGLEQVMIQGDNNLFLFIESPRCAGVSTMAGLGNGKYDPGGEGAEGLDCLENLSFTNFTPCIGCLLGDEYADRQSRSFSRANSGLNIGQGIFRLDKMLSDVRGAQLQQFNLSPQTNDFSISTNSVALEQNADFIQIAIPLGELGGLQPGDLVKLGAVVGRGAFDEAAQIRWLDTSVLGYSLVGSDMRHVRLEGLCVQLALPPSLDSDGDGLLDWQEQLAGTDPHDRQSTLRVNAAWVSSSQIRLSWQTVSGKCYQLEAADSLSAGFVPAAEPTFPRIAWSTNDTCFINLTGTRSSAARFYRIRLITE